MFASFFNKLSTFADHHQLIIGAIIAVSIILVTWGIERILETYVFKKNRGIDYLIAVSIGLSFLWIIKHFTLREW